MARRFNTSNADAEDAVQEVFVSIWRAAARFDAEKGDEATFITMIARRRLIDRLRKRKEIESLDMVDELPGVDASAVEGCAEVARVSEAITALESPQREALLMSVYAGFSHAAIAEHLNLPLGTVKTHLRRSMQKIRAQLGIETNQSSSEQTL